MDDRQQLLEQVPDVLAMALAPGLTGQEDGQAVHPVIRMHLFDSP